MDVAELQVFNVVAGDARDDRGLPRRAIGYDNVADNYASKPAYRNSLGTAHSAAQSKKQWHVGDVAHRDVGDGDVFKERAIHGLKRQSAATFDHAIRNRDIAESAVALSSEFYPAVARHLLIEREALIG